MISLARRRIAPALLILGIGAALVGICGTESAAQSSDVGAAAPSSAKATSLDEPVRTDAGYVAGTLLGSPDRPVHVYRGIPYAAAPVGELRWKAPQPVAPWEGVREATRFGLWATQRYPSAAVFEVADESDMAEDCLTLNVLTPARSDAERLPVMVWLHGGGLDTLSGNMRRYNSPDLPATGAVVVTISHRLGVLGYLAHPWLSAESPDGASGNYGQLDLIAALQWVQRNVAAFGGDPGRVTIFGQSGGGRKVNFLMVSPVVPDGLFQRAVSLSGSIGSLPKAEAEARGVALTDQLGVKDLAELRAMPWQKLVEAAAKVEYSGQLVENGVSLLGPIPQSFQEGKQKDVPYMIGMVGTEDAGHFGVPIQLVPSIRQRSSPVYAYVFRAVPSGWRSAGVTGWHAIDLGYLFASLDESFSSVKPEYFRAYPGRQGAKSPDPGVSTADRQLAERMKKIWVQFAATGNPSLPGVVDWTAYEPQREAYLEIDLPLAVKRGYSRLSQSDAPPPSE
jgi:para-nitrobenzyl esterase